MARLNVNGKVVEVEVEPDTPLLWALREQVGLTGTKYGCGVAQCGACTVHVDGVATRLRAPPVSTRRREAQKIVTIEGLSADGSHPVQKAWAALDVPQCGYCQAGMIMSAAALLQDKPKPTDADINGDDHQYLPLRHLQPRARRDQARGRCAARPAEPGTSEEA